MVALPPSSGRTMMTSMGAGMTSLWMMLEWGVAVHAGGVAGLVPMMSPLPPSGWVLYHFEPSQDTLNFSPVHGLWSHLLLKVQ